MGDYTARPTNYNGTLMRSRLEAGFAQLLDKHGLPWKYESRAFGSRAGQYLPDFEVIDNDVPWFFEVKPSGQGTPDVLERMKIILGTYPNARLEVFEGSWNDGEYFYQLAQQWPPPKPPQPFFVYVVPGCDSWHALPTVDAWFDAGLSQWRDRDDLRAEATHYLEIGLAVHPDISWFYEKQPKVYVLPDNDTGEGVLVYAVAFHKGDAALVSPIPLPWLTDYLVGQTTR